MLSHTIGSSGFLVEDIFGEDEDFRVVSNFVDVEIFTSAIMEYERFPVVSLAESSGLSILLCEILNSGRKLKQLKVAVDLKPF